MMKQEKGFQYYGNRFLICQIRFLQECTTIVSRSIALQKPRSFLLTGKAPLQLRTT